MSDHRSDYRSIRLAAIEAMRRAWDGPTSPEPEPTDLLNVDWDAGGRVHNWRNHVGKKTRELWATFTPEQRSAIAEDAETLAEEEEWD